MGVIFRTQYSLTYMEWVIQISQRLEIKQLSGKCLNK